MARLEPYARPSKYDDFADELDRLARSKPGDPDDWWLLFPGQENLTYGTLNMYGRRIRDPHHELMGIGFDARLHKHKLWVRRDPDFINP